MAHITPPTSSAEATSIKVENHINLRTDAFLFEFLFQLGRMVSIADNGIFRAELFALRRQLVHLPMPCQRKHAEFSGWRETTSKVLSPMLPVLPNMVRTCCVMVCSLCAVQTVFIVFEIDFLCRFQFSDGLLLPAEKAV